MATQLFETALEKRERLGPEASLLLESQLGLLLLRGGKIAEAKEVVEKGKVAVEDLQVRVGLYRYAQVFVCSVSSFVLVCVWLTSFLFTEDRQKH